jgi:hypothetical protein
MQYYIYHAKSPPPPQKKKNQHTFLISGLYAYKSKCHKVYDKCVKQTETNFKNTFHK